VVDLRAYAVVVEGIEDGNVVVIVTIKMVIIHRIESMVMKEIIAMAVAAVMDNVNNSPIKKKNYQQQRRIAWRKMKFRIVHLRENSHFIFLKKIQKKMATNTTSYTETTRLFCVPTPLPYCSRKLQMANVGEAKER
jgi:hypothetical protein